MDRNHRCRAIVLRTYPIGEIHKGIVLLTDTNGVVHAVAHGAASAKGRLRALAEVFVEGEATLYHNPVKQSTKLQDLDTPVMHYGLRENLVKYYAASFWVELIAASHLGDGEHDEACYELLSDALLGLERAAEERTLELSIYLMWRYLGLLGLAPQLDRCGECGREAARGVPLFWALGGGGGGGELRCADCRGGADGGAESAFELAPPARAYLRRLDEVAARAEDLLPIRLQAEQARRLHALLAAGLQQALETRFKTLESGAAVLYGR